MKLFVFQFLVWLGFSCFFASFLAGCVFSWKPSISDSSVSVTDSTTVEVPREAKE